MLMLNYINKKTHMSDEEKNEITSDDLNVLSVLLQNIKGISAVSTTTQYTENDDTSEQ